jgi:hypothetical protein
MTQPDGLARQSNFRASPAAAKPAFIDVSK